MAQLKPSAATLPPCACQPTRWAVDDAHIPPTKICTAQAHVMRMRSVSASMTRLPAHETNSRRAIWAATSPNAAGSLFAAAASVAGGRPVQRVRKVSNQRYVRLQRVDWGAVGTDASSAQRLLPLPFRSIGAPAAAAAAAGAAGAAARGSVWRVRAARHALLLEVSQTQGQRPECFIIAHQRLGCPTWECLVVYQLPHVLHAQAQAQAQAQARHAQHQGQPLPPMGMVGGQRQAPQDAERNSGA